MRYSIELGFMSKAMDFYHFAKCICQSLDKCISENLSSKYGRKVLGTTTYALKID